VAKYFNDFLTVDHFFDVTVDRANGLLLLDKKVSASANQKFDYFQQDKSKQENKSRKAHTQIKHGSKRGQYGNQGGKHLREALGNGLTQRVGVVGIAAHDIAVGMRVEIPERKRLHMREHFIAYFFQSSLLDDHHNPIIKQGGKHADKIKKAHEENCFEKAIKYGMCLSKQRNDVFVDQNLQEQGASRVGGSTQ